MLLAYCRSWTELCATLGAVWDVALATVRDDWYAFKKRLK